jgi:5'(3')-deoxyribonucleotidase
MNALVGRKIAIDMDEVLFPMISRLDLYYKRRYNKCPPTHYPRKYNYGEHYNMTNEESKEFVQGFYYSSEAYTTLPIAASVKSMNKLKENKNKLWIVTGRQLYPQCKNVTYYLIQKHFPNVFESVHFTNSYSLQGDETPKSKICELFNIDLLIDDSVANCKQCTANNVECILFGNYEWNKDSDDFLRIESWEKLK